MESATAVRADGWRRVSWPHPEWWSLGLSGAAWLMLLYRAAAGSAMYSAHGHSGHQVHGSMQTHTQAAWVAEASWWLVMIVAMMFPVVLDSIRTTAARSLWRRRHRAIGVFLTGYLGPWLMFGAAASLTIPILQSQIPLEPASAAAGGFVAALLWQVTRVKGRALLACHRTVPIAPAGWRADRDCLRYGWVVGASCLVSCWALMLACVLSGHSLPAMVGATAVSWAERNVNRPKNRLLCSLIAALALTFAIAPYV